MEGGDNRFTGNTVLDHPNAAQLHVDDSILSSNTCRQGTFQDFPVLLDKSTFSFVNNFRGCPRADVSAKTTAGWLQSAFVSSAGGVHNAVPKGSFLPEDIRREHDQQVAAVANRAKCAQAGNVGDNGMRV